MSDNYPEVYRGDIYYIAEGPCVGSEQKAGRPGIVVSNEANNKYSSNVEVVFLTTQEKKPLPTHVEVVCKTPSTALCENIQTVSKERLGDFIRICSTAEMKKIDEALLVSLGLTTVDALEDNRRQVVNLEAERNVYKQMYENLLDRMMSRVLTEVQK